MNERGRRAPLQTAPAPGVVVLLVAALGGCVSPAQQTALNAQEDRQTCAAMGAGYGSNAHTQCMLQQQQRRDNEHLIFMEQARIGQEMAQTAREMRENR